jgi:hypothetical protein
MPFIQAGTYTLISRRFPSALRNIIRVTPLPFVGAGNGIEFVELTYNITPTTPPTVGSIASTTPPRVFAFLPEEDFEIHRIVFQTEAPMAYGETSILLTPQPGGAVSVIYLFYQPIQFVGALVGSQLGVYFPREALKTHLAILQSENPVFVQWEVDPANSSTVTQVALTTGEEFPGEGPTDTSPP